MTIIRIEADDLMIRREETDGYRQMSKAGNKVEMIGAPMCVCDIMTTTLFNLSPDQSMADAANLLDRHPFRNYLIVDAGGKLAGVIADRDILHAHAVKADWQAHPVSDFMTSKVPFVTEDTPLSVAAEMMVTQRINCLPVVNDSGSVTGIVTSIDLLNTYRRVQQSIERRSHR